VHDLSPRAVIEELKGAWTPSSWRAYPAEQQPDWDDRAALEELRSLPPLIFGHEADSLARGLAHAAVGEAFVLQAGDCAEDMREFSSAALLQRLRLLCALSVTITYAVGKPVVKIGRIAGQFAKPRSSPVESQNGATLPSFRGHAVNDSAFEDTARRPDPRRLLRVYDHAMAKVNLIRAATMTMAADMHDLARWEEQITACAVDGRILAAAQSAKRALRFANAYSPDLATARVRSDPVYTAHEALLLGFEEALTRVDPATGDWYDCSAHYLWIGERTRRVDGAHAVFLSGIKNPIGVKLGPDASPGEALALCELLDPDREPGRVSFITRMGVHRIEDALPPIVRAVRDAGWSPVWICDPMHGNTRTLPSGVKTRFVRDVHDEMRAFFALQEHEGVPAGGLHLELTPEPVTECLDVGEDTLVEPSAACHPTLCDPRLNACQSVLLALELVDVCGSGTGRPGEPPEIVVQRPFR
jgi:3-deoxy-7-phosphoheptulonate synthase